MEGEVLGNLGGVEIQDHLLRHIFLRRKPFDHVSTHELNLSRAEPARWGIALPRMVERCYSTWLSGEHFNELIIPIVSIYYRM